MLGLRTESMGMEGGHRKDHLLMHRGHPGYLGHTALLLLQEETPTLTELPRGHQNPAPGPKAPSPVGLVTLGDVSDSYMWKCPFSTSPKKSAGYREISIHDHLLQNFMNQ